MLVPSAMVLVAALTITALLLSGSRREAERKEAFKAWTKLTGNTSGLTYEEWRSIVMATGSHAASGTLIFIPR
jgi:hypothetical protein